MLFGMEKRFLGGKSNENPAKGDLRVTFTYQGSEAVILAAS